MLQNIETCRFKNICLHKINLIIEFNFILLSIEIQFIIIFFFKVAYYRITALIMTDNEKLRMSCHTNPEVQLEMLHHSSWPSIYSYIHLTYIKWITTDKDDGVNFLYVKSLFLTLKLRMSHVLFYEFIINFKTLYIIGLIRNLPKFNSVKWKFHSSGLLF